ncbi:hypothetical protein BDP27DRAFT_1300327 [Rhodocollybia butyracea]|uniref:XRRM domain-containing protein n=1 Tax=Rhodocollybia butyracea TaxID=206335 RepID=A0A9P5U158_9AGAR|nr:hypothetical protein BDP27DRAFT_1300327 [Rhodocollybia butyracea]
MVLSGPTWSNWGSSSTSSSAQTDEGMYEVRCKGRTGKLDLEGGYTRNYWEKRTVYIENIPLSYRSVPGIYRFIRSIHPPSNSASVPHVQRISFPPHHLDVDTDSSTLRHKSSTKCKGFAFVVFSSLDEAESITTAWNWDRRISSTSPAPNPAGSFAASTPLLSETTSTSISEAQKHGFRALSKLRWDELKEEYVAWRQTLLDEAFAAQGTEPPTEYHHESAEYPIEDVIDEFEGDEQNQIEDILTLSSPYPPDCLLFIRNINPSTNKTTLRTLFGNALLANGMNSQDIDYVDYTKGMDTCYLRVSSPLSARALVTFFGERHLVQSDALDGTGAQEGGKFIQVELMQGKKEQVYWEKVPEKIRYEAVRKAVSAENGAVSSSISVPSKSSIRADAQTSAPSVPPTTPLYSTSAPYPLNCLLFARNVHPGTNKTTLRALFTHVLSLSRNSRDQKDGVVTPNGHDRGQDGTSCIDYVDYTKGTTTCHLRLSSSSDASFLVDHFRENLVVQGGPLDDGTSSSTAPNMGMDTPDTVPAHTRILVDLVQGTREKLYWEKVPLKIQQEAVRRATEVGLRATSDSVSAIPSIPAPLSTPTAPISTNSIHLDTPASEDRSSSSRMPPPPPPSKSKTKSSAKRKRNTTESDADTSIGVGVAPHRTKVDRKRPAVKGVDRVDGVYTDAGDVGNGGVGDIQPLVGAKTEEASLGSGKRKKRKTKKA